MTIREDTLKTIEAELTKRKLKGYTAFFEAEHRLGLYCYTVTIIDSSGIAGVSQGQSENHHPGVNVSLYHRSIRGCVTDCLDKIEQQKKVNEH